MSPRNSPKSSKKTPSHSPPMFQPATKRSNIEKSSMNKSASKSNVNNNKQYFLYLSVLLGLLMLLIDSTSDAIFSQQRAVAMFAYFALVMNTVQRRENITSK